MIKGIICYYSGSGNTKLACQYVAGRIKNAELELCNIVKHDIPDFSDYGIVGFATFTDFGGIPQYFCGFFEKLALQDGKNAFLLNTYGAVSLRTLRMFSELARSRGFNVFSGHSLHMPESYPPMRRKGRGADSAPDQGQLRKFDEFIARLDDNIVLIASGQQPRKERMRTGLLGTLIRPFPRKKAKEDFGIQQVNGELCIECGTCERGCPYEAIQLDPKPVFDHSKCYGCWYCYNHCPRKAIFTETFKGEFQYPHPPPELAERLTRDLEET